jgi:HEAT repeat protein
VNPYVHYLMSKLQDSETAAEAVQALLRIDDDRAVELLFDVLHSDSLSARRAAANILGQKGDRRAVGPLLTAYERSGSDDVQWAIVRALGRLRDPRALDLLVAATSAAKNSGWRLREAAAEALGDLGEVSAGDALSSVMASDSDSDVKAAAARALGRLRYSPARDALIRWLGPGQPLKLRQAAAEALGNLGDRAVIPELRRAVQDSDDSVAVRAVRALATLQAPDTAPSLVAFLQHSGHEAVRVAVAGVLGDLGDRRAVGPLIDALARDRSADVRSRAAKSLGKLGDPTAVQPLINALKKSGGEVRQWAAVALRQLGEPARDALMEELGKGHPPVRPLLVGVLDAFTDRDVVDLPILQHGLGIFSVWEKALRSRVGARDARIMPLLLAAAGDPSDRVRSAVAWALGELGGAAAVEPLIRLLDDTSWDVRMAATASVGGLGGQARDALSKTLVTGAKPWARCHAAQALGRLGQVEAAPSLVDALKDKSRQVRIAAAEALGELRARAAVGDLIPALADPDAGVRNSAAAALRLIEGADAERATASWDKKRRARLVGLLPGGNEDPPRFRSYP